ncbi:hypothetical protein HELRODRAFT_175890 [Helobdella robusta]|uniref:Uncharacterized protein n=1 Tax=Helobdella robusta TaxID=6412 RepID=T1F9U5_HELRO|nr:hypothetical protein HELRODRAFT_175890 [Helobdella robusta]ESO00458.1 hypothetical protein HELRODRAFT_175890 [Helobdella robusta]
MASITSKLYFCIIKRNNDEFELAGISENKETWYVLPEELKDLSLHEALSTKRAIINTINSIKPINGYRTICIKLDDELRKEYYDEDENLCGSLIDYALAKKNLCLEIEMSRINMIVMGLPVEIQNQLDREEIATIEKLFKELTKIDECVSNIKPKYDNKFLSNEISYNTDTGVFGRISLFVLIKLTKKFRCQNTK